MALPDLIEIVPLDKPVHAEITVPGSKSITNRALILAALADGEVTLEGALWSEDTQIMVEALQKLGFQIKIEPDAEESCNRTIRVKGLDGKIPNGGTAEKPLELFVGNAGTAARFLAAMVCLGSGVYRLLGTPRMHERPQAALFKVLRELGYRVESENGNDKLPATLFGRSRGNEAQTKKTESRKPKAEITQSLLTSSPTRKCEVSIKESSQFASALLLCAKVGGWAIKVVGENTEESPYVAMTQSMLAHFSPWVEPDASSSSYMKAIGWIFPREILNPLNNQLVQVPGVTVPEPDQSLQVDRKFHNYFQRIGHIRLTNDNSNDEVSISRLNDLGDSIMTAIVMTPLSSGRVRFTDLGRLRVQECERVVALRTELTRCGAKVVEEGDTLTVFPSQLHGAEIETYHDHRMAMCFAILGLKVPGIKIKNPACVKKTFPNFFQKLTTPPPKGLGAVIWEIKNDQRIRKLSGKDLFAE